MSNNIIMNKKYKIKTIGNAVQKETSLTLEEISKLIGVRVSLLDSIFDGDKPLSRTVCDGLTKITNKKKTYWKKIDREYQGTDGI